MAARQIKVTLVGDEKDFVRAADAAGKSAEKLEGKLQGAGSEARAFDQRMSDLGEGFDDAETPIIGVADLMDGLATTMGMEGLASAVSYTRGIGDMASGLGNGLIPVLGQATAKVKGMSAALLASPMGKFKVAAALAAVAVTAVAAENGNLNYVMDKGKGILSDSLKGWDMLTGKLLGIVGASGAAQQSLEDLQKAGKVLNGPDALTNPNAVSVGDLKNWKGSVSTEDWSAQNAWDRSQRAAKEAMDAANAAIAAAGKSAADKTAKEIERAGKEANTKLQKAFDAQVSVLDRALDKWRDSVNAAKAMRDQIKGLFDLDVKNDDPMGLVAGLRKQAADMNRFVKVIADLRRKGFREGLVQGLVDRGPASLADAVELSHVSRRDVNALYDQTQSLGSRFGRNEALLRTGVDPSKPAPVRVTLDVKGSDKELVSLIKKWVRTEGGGNVQVAFGKR